MSLLERLHPHEARPAPTEIPRGVQPARLGGPAGVSREVLRDLNAAAKRDRQPLTQPQAHTDPTPELRASTALELATYVLTGYVLDDTAAALAQFANLLRPMIETGWPVDHVTRMVLMPIAARIGDLLDAELSGPAEYSTWDHRPLGVSIGRELGEVAL